MICTFYSYKGGVGRSMAIANVAEWMYLHRHLRVVLIDWDLEAPGLESFFPADDRRISRLRQPGLIDLLLDYMEDLPYLRLPPDDAPREEVALALAGQLPPLRARLLPLRRPATPDQPAVWLLPAGRREGEAFAAYARSVQRFDWSGFYERYRGEAFFEWLRSELLAEDLADVVLIDTRTGISEMGGVATRQLADVIVSFCVLNTQNIEGVGTATRSFLRPEVLEARGRAVQVLVVPTRIETTEINLRNQAQSEFTSALEDLRPEAMKRESRMFWDLGIPQVAKYAYKEKLAVGASDTAEELVNAYAKLADQILALAPEGSTARRRADAAVTVMRPEPVSLPAVSNLPPRLPLVVGRDTQLAEMRSRLTGPGAPLVLYGLGGVGKTTLAIEYAYRFQPEYELIWWIEARTPESIARGYVALAGQLDLGGSGGEAVEAARRWLAAHARWLLILDGAEEAKGVEAHIPRERRGHLVLTSRDSQWGNVATAMEVPALGRDDAVELLRGRIGEADPVAMQTLAEALGGLPLALAQASAYMEATGRSADDYLQIFQEEGVRFLDRGADASLDAESVTASLQPSYRAVLRDPPARDLLAFCCMLGRDAVPLELLVGVGADAGLKLLSVRAELDRAIVGLRRHSLASMRDGALWVHPLVQAQVREWLGPEASRWATRAVSVMRDALRVQASSPQAIDRLLPHARAALEHATALRSPAAESLGLLETIAACEESLGRPDKARDDLHRAVRQAVEALRPNDPLVDELARKRVELLIRQGDLKAAEAALGEDLGWAQNSGSKPALLRVLGDGGVIALRLHNLGEAERLTNTALDIAELTGAGYEKARLLINLAVLHQRRGMDAAAAQLVDKSRDITVSPQRAPVIAAAIDAFNRGECEGLLQGDLDA